VPDQLIGSVSAARVHLSKQSASVRRTKPCGTHPSPTIFPFVADVKMTCGAACVFNYYTLRPLELFAIADFGKVALTTFERLGWANFGQKINISMNFPIEELIRSHMSSFSIMHVPAC
jgi:hypothetical protein